MKRQSGAKAMVLALILFSPPLIWSSARADLLSLSFATIATAVDTGQQEGIFDLFALSNPDSLINNGVTSFSTTAEFDLSSRRDPELNDPHQSYLQYSIRKLSCLLPGPQY